MLHQTSPLVHSVRAIEVLYIQSSEGKALYLRSGVCEALVSVLKAHGRQHAEVAEIVSETIDSLALILDCLRIGQWCC
jgi:hypothetical protein